MEKEYAILWYYRYEKELLMQNKDLFSGKLWFEHQVLNLLLQFSFTKNICYILNLSLKYEKFIV